MAKPTFISAVNLTPGTSASPGAQSVTVPSDATHALLHWSAFMDGVNPGLLTGLTSNFGTWTRQQFNGAGISPNYWNNTGTAWAAVTATGSRTITPTWTTGLYVAPVFMISFWKDVNPTTPVLDQDALSEDDEVNAPSITLTSTADCAVVALDAAPLGSPPSNPAGWTSRLTMTSGDGHSGRLREANSPGASTTTATCVSAFYSTISAISLQGSSGTAYTGPQAESITFSDSQAVSGHFAGAQAETITFSDSQTVSAKFLAAQEESISFSDAQTAAQVFSGQQEETISFSDEQQSVLFQGALSEETISFADNQEATLYAVGVQEEQITFADDQTAYVSASVAQIEDISFSDDQVANSKYSASQEETISLSDSQTSLLAAQATQMETISFSDIQEALFPGESTIVETITFTDEQQAVGVFYAEQVENIVFVDEQTATGVEPETHRGGGWAPQIHTRRKIEKDVMLVDVLSSIETLAPTPKIAVKAAKAVRKTVRANRMVKAGAVDAPALLEALDNVEKNVMAVVEKAMVEAKKVARRRRQDEEIMMML